MSEDPYEGIAIIGMAGRFPGAENIEEFWTNLVAGKETISFFSDAELAESGLDTAALNRRGQYVPARGVLKDADCFDAAFFGVHPKEAEVTDPQQRVFLEACWAALERAGYAPSQVRGTVGVFAGVNCNTYYPNVLQQRPDLLELVGSDLVMLGNEKDYLTTRVAYKLGLKGPALNVSTACSTSLVAVCQACLSLLTHQCDMALAGGASVRVPQKSGYYYDEGNIGSSDGHTRTFDVQASGTAFSNGVGVVVLKRLEDAVNGGDRIYAVIKGAALNNDGSQRVSFGAPGVEGQSEVIAMAHALAGVDPATISCVEAHGTATPLGDPIEVAGLTKAFRLGTQARQFCALGSVKTNVGHLDAAAGVTGLIKMALALHNKLIPASLHFTKPNPKLNLDNSPFYVNAALQQWNTKPGVPRRAGVSSFGTGGTNAHLVIEEAPELPPPGPSRPWQLLVLSAKTADALERATAHFSDYLKHLARLTDADAAMRELADAAFTLQTGRSEFVHRRIVACQSAANGVAALETRDPKRVFTHHQQLSAPPVVFMFPGQGAQYPGMGAELYRIEPVFRAEVDRCVEFVQPILKIDLCTVMFPATGSEKESEELLVQTRFTQPALFVMEYALAKLWMSWGVKPAAMIGHSVGEYVAACLAGVFTLEDALSLVARRGALVQAQPGGSMLSVRLPENEVVPLLNPALSIAAINSPHLCVVSGPHDAIAVLEEQLVSRGVSVRHLHTSHAFHSAMMEPVLAPFTELLRRVKLHDPQTPFVSNVTARWITAEEAKAPEYWAGHVRQTVRFAEGVGELLNNARNVLLEVGPGQTLSTLARQHPAKSANQVVLASLPLTGDQEPRGILEALGRLWMAGVTPDWQRFYANESRRRVVLPTYPFERKRYWPEPASTVGPLPIPPGPPGVMAATAAPPPVPSEAQAVPVSVVLPAPQTQGEPDVPRKERLLVAARSLLHELSGYDLSGVDPSTNLLELGLDSLLLTQAATLFQRKFGASISFRQLMEELGSLDAIAAHLDATLPPEKFAVTPAAPSPVSTAAPGSPPSSVLEQLLQQQQQLTNQLLQLMGQQPASAPAPSLPVPPALVAAAKSEIKSHGPFKPFDRAAGLALSPNQSRALDAWIARYSQRTPRSKQLAAENRPFLADPRSAAGFKQLWKEMVYPLVTTRSDGSKVWDVDGNEYVDFVMGFGASMFGHRPPFVVKAVQEQLERGFEIGPIQPLAGEVAALVKEFTGMERVGFTNTGSEAVLAATRVARTVTGRDKIAVFAGAYHGIFDEVLFRPLTVGGQTRAAAIAPGIPDSALGQVIVLDYGNPQSLEILRAYGSEIAAVLVEPVQSRRLDLQPREFLHELRRVTQQTGSALIFDEVVTGFRLHPGGAQAYFDVRADLATYGKVIGGGLPIGVVSGDAKYMDALDGGKWQYGDTSFPEVGVTFFAGTFVRHPLALAAAKAVLTHLKQAGPELQRRLNERTAQVASQLQALLDEFQAPYHLTQFSSIMHLTPPPDQKFAGLLFYLLRERGIHIWENRAFIITTAHTDEDFARLIRAFRESLTEMRSGEFLPPSDRVGQAAASSRSPTVATPARELRTTAVTEPAGPSGTFPLTEAQKEIWLAAQMGGDAAVAYNESLKLQFRGVFDVEVFRAAVRRVVGRHPILLANLSPDGLWQQVRPETQLDLPLFDLSAQNEAERERGLTTLLEAEVSEPFDLVAGPLLRIRIARLSTDHHVVIWTAHHIVCDGWSGTLLVSELAVTYSALKQGIQPVLEAPIPFREYAVATQTDTPVARDAMAYWRQQFAEVPLPLVLPADRPRPLVRTARASTLKRALDPSLRQSLKRTAGQQRTTLVVLLMAALKTLLHRLTGQTDLVIGLGVAGQSVTGKTCLVGHCVNLLPVRTRLKAEASFQENLAAVKKSVLDAYDHHQCTIGGILQHLKVPRNAGRPPLVEVIFNVDQDLGAAEFHDLEFACEQNAKRALHFDLFFNFVEGARGLCVECNYNTDLFDAATIERWLRHYQTLLEGIAVNPTETLGQLPILTEAERKELTIGWNQTGVEFPKGQTLHEWFERQVEKTPDACAVTFEGTHLTYGELNRRANHVAHHLRALGVGPDVLVGLFVERSLEMVVGILGILKAGGAYLPIDPVYPKDRLAFMLEDASAPILLTQSTLALELPAHKAKVVCFDTDRAVLDREPETNPPHSSTPDHLAYVIYTSGSTGKPKGSLITHYNVVRLMQATEPWYQFTEHDVWTFFHSHAFDFSVWELYGALLYGGRVVMVPYLTSRSPEAFYELLVSERVTVLNQTPSAFKQLMQAEETLGARTSLALRYVIFGGEALEMQSLSPWFDRHGDQHPLLVNMYGITETTVHVTYRPLSVADMKSGSVVGVPIPDLQVYILDQYQQPVPIGVVGEICVGGAGVARGYLKREELTRQTFLPDVFTNKPMALLYRSGDLARFLPNREIEHCGRMDRQVKIRGFRVELGEVEAVLGCHDAVRQCVVIAREDIPGDKRLVAYVVPIARSVPSVSDLRLHLRRDLPDYMIPAAFVHVEELPLTPNGKIDYKALPPPDAQRVEIDGEFAAPRDPIEQVLSQLWSKVLKVRRVGLHDNFFELGGHSILAVRIIVEIEKLYKKRLPLATLLQAPTIGELAEVLRQEHWEPSWSSLVPIRAGGSNPPLFLMHSHGGNILEYYPLANLLAADQPVYALQARGLDGHIVKGQTLEMMAATYLEELRSLQPEGPYFLGGFCFGGLMALEAAQQLCAAGEEVALVVMIQTMHPASALFRPSTSMFHRWWYRAAKRIDLERENLSHREKAHLKERFRRIWDVARARTAIAFDSAMGSRQTPRTNVSTPFILESLGIEHDRVFEKYVPRPYSGDVVLFRASKQLQGLVADLHLGWKDVINGHLDVCEVTGHQQSMLSEPNVSRLAEELASRLQAVQQQHGLKVG
jgi:amino acid adenylation domain-containing protein